MKKIFLLHLILLALITSAHAQKTDDELQKSPTCFFVAHNMVDTNKEQISKTYCIGDKISVKLNDNKIISGILDSISTDNRILVNGIDIDVSTVQWIKNTRLSPIAGIAGGLFAVVGVALIINGADGEFGNGPAQIGLGIASIVAGGFILTTHAKFKIEKDDKWVFNH